MNPFELYGRTDNERFPGYSEYEGQRESTTFFADFSVAEPFGIKAVKDTYKRCMKAWKDDYKYLTELVNVLNHKLWYWYQKNEELAQFYNQAFAEAQAYGYKHLKGAELSFFHGVLD